MRHFSAVLGNRLNNKFIIEDDLQILIDSSYPKEMKEALGTKVGASVQEVQDAIVNRFQPFGLASSTVLTDLERKWEELFDGQEVLPKALADKARTEEHWMGRARYLVPLSSYLYRWLKPEFDEELNCDIVDVAYDPELGLEV